MRIFTVDLGSTLQTDASHIQPDAASTQPDWADTADTVQVIGRPSSLAWACIDHQPDAVVLTVDTAGTYDTVVTQALRTQGVHTPVLVLAQRSDPPSAAKTLESGADDVLSAPASVVELRARLRALARRPATWEPDEFSNGEVTVDLLGHRALANGQDLDLTPVQFRLLSVLMRNAGRTLTRDQLRESAWDPAEVLGSNVVEQAVSGLRTKLAERNVRDCLKTVRGVGYRMELVERTESAA
ncbi:winged helix-turn-helix transcriptional regulator [Kocuria sp.]|uniref:winged helix-turn-helix transcriptional regulator n=1 Tax=Kocuria sp. TaxID=1871328 RepID=UPI0026E04D9D|nr:response regulator transcription factor [Kocuria sp.]MDO5619180.1 response regulator transcription factor [Kocuria sp.]